MCDRGLKDPCVCSQALEPCNGCDSYSAASVPILLRRTAVESLIAAHKLVQVVMAYL